MSRPCAATSPARSTSCCGSHSDAGPRYLVVDYKTNWLGPTDQPLTAHHYRPEALAGAMGHSDYPLQALLYAAVLHRFLRWRQPGYDPAQHLGGVLYLYLRGMCGPGTPLVDGSPCGVFAWQPPVALVEELSDLLDGGGAMTELFEPVDEHDWRLASGRRRSAGRVQRGRGGELLRRPCRHPPGRPGRGGRRADAARGRARRPGRAPWLGVPRPRGRFPTSLPGWRGRPTGRPGRRGVAARRGRAWCGGSSACSTSTATTGSRPRSSSTSRPGSRRRRPRSTRPGWARPWPRCAAATSAPSRRPRWSRPSTGAPPS